jgi:hypothetical protein
MYRKHSTTPQEPSSNGQRRHNRLKKPAPVGEVNGAAPKAVEAGAERIKTANQEPPKTAESSPVAATSEQATSEGQPNTSNGMDLVKPTLVEPEEKAPTQPDQYGMASLLLDPEDGDDLGLVHQTVSLGFGKPKSSWWFRVFPEEPKIVRILTVEEEGEMSKAQYLITPALAKHPSLATERAMRRARLYRCINRAGEVFLWAVKVPGPDGKLDRWNSDAHIIAEAATKEWVRMQPGESTYVKTTCPLATDLPEPTWPAMSFEEIMQLALKDHVIGSIDHPVLQKLLKGAVKK